MFPQRQPVSLYAPDRGKTATVWAALRPHQGASGSRRQAFASGTGDMRFLMRSRAPPMPSQCTASTPRLPSRSRAFRTAVPAGSRPGPAAGFHGAHSKGDVAAVPPYDRRNVAYAAPCRARGAVGCSRGRKQRLARNAAPEERVCEPDAEGAEPKLAPEPVRAACKPHGRDPASSRASARRPERVGPPPPRPPARGGRPACSPSCRTRASLGASNPMWLFGFVTGGVSGNRQAGAPARWPSRAPTGPAPAAGAVPGKVGRPVRRRTPTLRDRARRDGRPAEDVMTVRRRAPPYSCRRIFATPRPTRGRAGSPRRPPYPARALRDDPGGGKPAAGRPRVTSGRAPLARQGRRPGRRRGPAADRSGRKSGAATVRAEAGGASPAPACPPARQGTARGAPRAAPARRRRSPARGGGKDKWWTEGDLNPRPPACKAGILPLYYQPAGDGAGRPDFNRSRRRGSPARPTLFIERPRAAGVGADRVGRGPEGRRRGSRL